MKKYAALIEIGWVKRCFEGNNPYEIIREVEKIQDFSCLMRMGRMEEDRQGQKELNKLERFLRKYYNSTLTIKDIKNLDIHLSLGNIKCHGLAETEEEVIKLISSATKH